MESILKRLTLRGLKRGAITLTLAVRGQSDVEMPTCEREGPILRDRVRVAGRTYPINPDGFFGLRFSKTSSTRGRP